MSWLRGRRRTESSAIFSRELSVMGKTCLRNPQPNPMSDREFKRFRELIQSEFGVKMPPAKRTMLQGRLQKRLRVLKMHSFGQYLEYVLSPEGVRHELDRMIDLVTTHKTDFFREPSHFEYLVRSALPELVCREATGIRKRLRVWSAGCSTGEEPYTLAMVIQDFAEGHPGFDFSILGTDISRGAIETARRGIYSEETANPIPPLFKKKYLLKSRDPQKKLVRISSGLRDRVHFRVLNFMDDEFGIRGKMDIIFCRNVIIYFDRPTQEILLSRLSDRLSAKGYLFMGHSETLNGMDIPLVQVAPTVYRVV